MSELPKGWATTEIGEVIELNPKNTCDDATEVGFIPMPLMGTTYRERPKFEPKPWREVKKGYTHFADGDVLLAKITPCFENGKGGLVEGLPNGMGTGSTEYFICRPRAQVLSARYLLAYFKTNQFIRNGTVEMTGSVGHKRVPKEYLTKTEIPLAPLPEQKRIADKLDSTLARVEVCRDRLDRLPALLKRFRQSILAAATSGRLTDDWRSAHGIDEKRANSETPTHWQEMPLGQLIHEMRNGLSPKPTEQPPGAKILRISSVRPGKVDFGDHRYLEIDEATLRQYSLETNDLLFTRYNGSLEFLGVCAHVPLSQPGYVYPDKLIRVRANAQKIFPKFIELVFGSQFVREQVEAFVKSSAGQKGISGSDLKTTRIPVPPLDEQHEIVRRVETLFAFADRLEARLATARKQVEQLTPALLAKAFRGELVPQDPADEPASELLKRLAASRAETPKPKRGKRPAA